MSFDPPLRRMRVEAFRGFRDAHEFDLAASAVIVTGPNGTGKTSFFDAMQWCLVGSIERLEGLRSRRNVEHIVNQYRLSDRASVDLELSVRGRRFSIRRTGDHRGSTLEFREHGLPPRFGDEAEQSLRSALAPHEGVTVASALSTSGLMQQDVMRAVLEAKPAERYRHLSSVLGLSELETFEQEVRDAARDAKARADASSRERETIELELRTTRSMVEAEERRRASRPQLEALRDELERFSKSAPAGLVLELNRGSLAEGSISETAKAIDDAIDRLVALEEARRQLASLASVDDPGDVSSEVRSALEHVELARANVAESRLQLENAKARYELAESASAEMARLAAAAIPLLSGHCPVCGQDIDADHVRTELVARSGETDIVLVAQQNVEAATREVRDAERAEHASVSGLKALQDVQRAWEAYSHALELLTAATEAMRAPDPPVVFHEVDGEFLPNGSESMVGFLRSVKRRIGEYIEAANDAADRSALERAASEERRLAEVLSARAERAEADALRASELKALEDATLDARVEVTEARFKAVQPLVSDIYSRLDPHPAFKAIEFELDTYYRRGTTSPLVRDAVAGVTADPLMIFSTSQANIAALSYFLAMGWSAGDAALPFVLLDDPIQSMDDVNVLGFADLCRHLRQDRQLIISTHERRFAGLLERKLAPRLGAESTRTIRFVAWDRSGPVVEEEHLDSQYVADPIRVVQVAS